MGRFYNNGTVRYLSSLDSNDGKNMDCRLFETFTTSSDDGKPVKRSNALAKPDDDSVNLSQEASPPCLFLQHYF